MMEAELKIRLPEGFGWKDLPLPGEAEWVSESEQIDVYLSHPSRDFAATDEALRIRKEGRKCWLTYKGPKRAAAVKTREELEVAVSCADTAVGLLGRLGFTAAAQVCKRRRIFRWREVLICLDEVDGLGRFVEIEMAQPEKAGQAETILAGAARMLGLDPGAAMTESYLELLVRQGSA